MSTFEKATTRVLKEFDEKGVRNENEVFFFL
jgi:hypothetical protein